MTKEEEQRKFELNESIKLLTYVLDCVQHNDDFNSDVRATWFNEFNIMLRTLKQMDYKVIEKPDPVKYEAFKQQHKTLNLKDLTI